MKDAFTIRHHSIPWAELDESSSRSHVSTTPRSFKVFLPISQPMNAVFAQLILHPLAK